LNSVLDDNHLLTLPNGERINFGPNVNFVFETNNLKFASPATVSRMGVIYMSEEDVEVSRLVNTWIRKQDQNLMPKITTWIEEYFYSALEWVLHNDQYLLVQTTKVGIVSNVLTHLIGVKTKSEFAISIIRGFGSNFPIEIRNKFANEFFALMDEKVPDSRNPLDCNFNEKHGGFKSYAFDPSEAFLDHETLSYETPPLIQTVGIQRDINFIKKWLDNSEPFIVVGPEGCGKSLLLNFLFTKLKSTQVSIHQISSSTLSR